MSLSLAPLPALPSIDATMQAATAPQGEGLGVFDQVWIKLAKLANPSQASAIDQAAAASSAPAASSQAQAAADQAATAAAKAKAAASSAGGGIVSGVEGLGSFFGWAADVVNRPGDPQGGVSLEDLVLIVLGLVLLAAAVVGLIFTFDQTKKVAGTITKQARGVVDSKAASALAALAA